MSLVLAVVLKVVCACVLPLGLATAELGAGETCRYQHCLWANNSEGVGVVWSLDQALEDLSDLGPHYSSAELRLTAGLFNLSNNHLLTFVNWSNLSIVGEGKEKTTLQCQGDVGIVFRNSTGVTLRDLTITHCNRWLNTTSVNFSDLNAANTSHNGTKFTVSKSGVYFDSCSNLNLSGVEVCRSSGMGVTIYNTKGNNRFTDADFKHNYLITGDLYPGGGGVVIETSYCAPGDASCRDDWSELVTKDASYVFERCSFMSNRATSHYLPFDSVYPHARSHMGLGKGGGLSVSLKGHAYHNKVVVNDSSFVTNSAEWGGAMYVALGDTSVNNSILIVNSSIDNNNADQLQISDQFQNRTVGGALRIELISYPPDQQLWPGYVSNVTGNSITLSNTDFWNNLATWGGAVSFTTTRDVPGQISPNSLHIERCMFAQNQANIAAWAIDITSWKPDIIDSQEPFMHPVISDCIFDSNKMLFNDIQNYPMGLGALYISGVPTDFSGENTFVLNEDTAMAVCGTYVSIVESSKMNFTQNSGRRGGALSFIGDSWLIAHEGTSFLFDSNSVGAYGLGGAVYSVHFGENLVNDHNCFFRYHVYSVPPSMWNTTFRFRDNRADQKLNAIYTTCSLPCAWHVWDTLNEKPGGGAFCENTTWIFEGSNRSCLNEVSTGPNEVVAKNISLTAVPGWKTTLGIQTLNDFGSPLPPVLTASPTRDCDRGVIAVANSTEYISNDVIVVYGQETSTADMLLTTLDPRVVASEVFIHILPCPPGFVAVTCPEDDAALVGMTCNCVCANNIPGIECHDETKVAYLLPNNCISSGKNGSDNSIVIATCPFQDKRILVSDITAEQLEERVCKVYNRQGFLCSKCSDGYGVAINKYAYDCVECKGRQKYNWAWYLLLELGPITLVCFIVILFGVSVAAPSMNAFVFFSQIVSVSYGTNPYTWFFGVESISKKLSDPVFFLYGMWNLEFFKDFLPGICLHDGLKVLHILVINYVKALYPMVLLGICYTCVKLYDRNFRILHILWKPFRYCQKVIYKKYQPKTSLVDAFATLIVLSYSKFMYVSFPLVNLISVYKLNGNSTGNSSLEYLRYHYYFDPEEVLHHSLANIVYFLLGVVVLVVFVGLPPIFLFLYPIRFTQSCLGRLNVRLQISLRTFADIFIGAFRDGTSSGGGRDCRWFAALYLILRIVFLTINTVNVISHVASYLIQQILCTLCIFIFALVQPYKENFYNHLDTSFFALLAILNSLSFYNSHLEELSKVDKSVFYVNYILIYLPLLYLALIIVYNILAWRGCFKRSEDSFDEGELSEGRFTSDDISTTTEDHLPDRFIHPQDYTTLNKFSSMGGSSSKKRSSGRRWQSDADQRRLLADGSAPLYGTVQGYTV